MRKIGLPFRLFAFSLFVTDSLRDLSGPCNGYFLRGFYLIPSFASYLLLDLPAVIGFGIILFNATQCILDQKDPETNTVH